METDRRRAQFVEAALKLFAEQGIARTSIGDISNRVGVARSLFYHYFPNKDAVIDAVLNYCVADFADKLEEWERAYDPNSAQTSLLGIVRLMRAYLNDPEGFFHIIVREDDNALRLTFGVRSSEALARRYDKTRCKGRSHVRHPKETFYVMVMGLLSIIVQHPDVPDETLAELVDDVMHISSR